MFRAPRGFLNRPLKVTAWLCSLGFGLTFAFCDVSGQASAPFLVMYGHSDDAGATDHFRDVLVPTFNVIEGTSTNVSFIKELRNQGKVYAAHVNNPTNESASQLLARWRAPFENTLGGRLSGGYDAIAIDELHGASTDGTPNSDAVTAALGELRGLYPNKQIFVATTWHYGQHSGNYTDQLTALNQQADLIMIENYLREDNYNHGYFVSYADNLKRTVTGILAKTVYGLYIPQGNFAADTSTAVGFWGFLDDQLRRIRNDADARTMPGVMFWVYYQSEKDLTPDYVARLVDHYYVRGSTDFFGDGSLDQLISNPRFDQGSIDWSLTSGLGGNVQSVGYASNNIPNDHDKFGQTPHGDWCLKMRRGGTPNEAAFRVDGLDTSLVYTVSAFVFSERENRRAMLAVRTPNGTTIQSETVSDVGSPPDFYHRWNEWSRLDFHFVPTTSSVDVVLSDEPATQGTHLYWDFVELESAFPASVLPLPDEPFRRGDVNEDGLRDLADPLFQLFFSFVPGSPGPACLDSADSNDDGQIDNNDVIRTLFYLFSDGPSPRPPYFNCGLDPTEDELGCAANASCAG